MNLILTQEHRHYDAEDGSHVSLRIIQPSAPAGVWPGNERTIREWQICPRSQAHYRRCTEDEVRELEAAIGEVKAVTFGTHPTLGLVAYEGAEDEPHSS